MPLVADCWEQDLRNTSFLSKYNQIPLFIPIPRGAFAGIPKISHTFTPPNKESTETLSHAFFDIIQSEFSKGHYLGPFSCEELEHKIGPFQSSPLSLVPKSGKPGKFCLIQNLSFSHTNLPVPSINSSLCSENFPCTWGIFCTVATLISNLPPGSQAAIRDISEAYQIIPLQKNQWPGVVVRLSNKPEIFALNTCNSFGCTTAGGLFGLFGDALADLLRARGIGPVLKWVNDFIFFRIPTEHIPACNTDRDWNQQTIEENSSQLHSKGRLWYKGKYSPKVGHEHFVEDLTFPLRRPRDNQNGPSTHAYDFDEINEATMLLGIPWELSKDIPFNNIVPFIGFHGT
jgi:hypothetical protein